MKAAITREELQQLSPDQLIDLVLGLQQADPEASSRQHNGGAEAHALSAVSPDAALKIIPGMANVHKQYRKALSDQTARAELLTQVAIELNETLAIEEIIERVLRATAAKLAMTEVSIVLIDPRGNIDVATAMQRDGFIRPMPPELARNVLDQGLAGWVLRHNHTVVLSHVADDPRWIARSPDQKSGSVIAMPIKHGETLIGVMTLFHEQPNHFPGYDPLLLEGLAALVSLALTATRRRISEMMRRDQSLALLSTSQHLTVERTLEDVAMLLQEKSVSLFDVTYGLLFLSNEHGVLAPVAVPATLAAQQNKTIVEEAMQTANNAWDENTIELQTTTTNDSIHTYVALPLMYNGYATGVLVLVRIGNPAMAFSVTIWSVLTVFTSLIASTCANMQLIARLQQHLERMDELLEQYTQQLKHSRDVLRTVFDNVPNGLVLLDAQERLLAANTTFCQQIIGQHPRELVGRPYATIWSLFRQRTDVHIAMQETLLTVSPESDRSVTMKQVHCTDGIGQQRWFEVTRHPIIDDTNTIMQYLERWREIIDMQIKNWA